MVSDRVREVLFLCTGNSARSVLAESALNALGEGRFRAHSAGSHPTGRVHPMTLRCLEARGHPTEGLRSQGFEAFAGPDAPDWVRDSLDRIVGGLPAFGSSLDGLCESVGILDRTAVRA